MCGILGRISTQKANIAVEGYAFKRNKIREGMFPRDKALSQIDKSNRIFVEDFCDTARL